MFDETLYTPEEVAQILKISKYTVYEMIKRGELSAHRIGRKLRINNVDLEQYIHNTHNVKHPENILEGEIIHEDDGSFIIINNTKIRVVTDYEGSVKISIRPEDIILTNEPFKSSARNILPCTVLDIKESEETVYVKLNAGFILTALITMQSLKELDIYKGKQLFAVFKTTAVNIRI